MNVLIAGANGHTGRLLVEYLAKNTSHDPYAMVRDENQAGEMIELGAADVRVADLEGEICSVMEGMGAVIFAAGSGSSTGPDKTISVDQEGAKKLVDAAKSSSISHFIMLSSIGADDPQGPLEHYLSAKKEADDYLKNSGLTYTIVRPGKLTFDEPTGKIDAAEQIEILEDSSIPRADVAHVLAVSLDFDNVKNRVFDILSGDKDIEPVLKML